MQKIEDHIYLLVIIGMVGTTLLAMTIIIFYIRHQRRTQKHRRQLQQAELQHQKALLHASIRSQEDERKRIGRDLHDDVGAALSNLRLVIHRLASSADNPQTVSTGKYCKDLIDRTLDTVRHISHNLSPSGMELFGFYDTVEELCQTISLSGDLRADISNITDEPLPELDYHTCLALYRVLQELLTNTIRHAQASRIVITFHALKDELTIRYNDNGIGFDPLRLASGMGMQNIESRLDMIGAPFSIITSKGNGFIMQIRLPLLTSQNETIYGKDPHRTG